MATKAQRFFALGGALLFFITASFLTIAFIIANIESSHNKTTNSATTGSKAATQTTPSQTASKTASTTKLQGTKMENFTPVTSVTQLQASDLTVGTGAAAKDGDTLSVDYTGALAATGVIFQSSLDSGQQFSFTLGKGQVIPGWDQGVVGMKVGGTRRLVIPANLAYGANAQNGIPANSPLVFDITLHSIK